MDYVNAFIVGGLICTIGQIMMDKTKLTPARVLVLFVTLGAILQGFGLYQKLVDIGGAGATVPLPGFGYALAKGAIEGAKESGIIGAFTGGITATSGGVAGAIVFGYMMSILFNPRSKR